MKFIIILSFLAFVMLQVAATILFKWGSTDKSKWIWGFIIANVLGIISTWFLMIIYKHLNPNLAFGIGFGSSFILSQIGLSVIFKSKLKIVQWALLSLITTCILLFTILN